MVGQQKKKARISQGDTQLDLEWIAEGLDCCVEVDVHPLWRAALKASLEAPSSFVLEAALEQQQLRCFSAGVILITTKGDLILQRRRLGLQCFAGGKYKHCLAFKAHSARREAYWEANVDMCDAAIVFISAPFLVTSACHMEWEGADFAACWLQVVVVEATAVTQDDAGVLRIGERILWSREVAGGSGCYMTNPPASTVASGTHWNGSPIFCRRSLAEALGGNEMRNIDASSLHLLREEVEAALLGQHRKPAAYFDWKGCTVQETYEETCKKTLLTWEKHFGHVASDKWPLIATPLLYETLTLPDWRRGYLAGYTAGLESRAAGYEA